MHKQLTAVTTSPGSALARLVGLTLLSDTSVACYISSVKLLVSLSFKPTRKCETVCAVLHVKFAVNIV